MTSVREEIRRLSKQGQPFNCRVRVESVAAVSDGFTRVAVVGDELAGYRDALPADAFKLLLPPEGRGGVEFPERGGDGLPYWPPDARPPVFRAFTVRRFDPGSRRITFDVLRHDGFTRRWLDSAAVGDTIGLAGMRREFHAGTGVDHHLLIGDASALPAIAAITESLPPRVPASVYLAAGHASDRDLLRPRANVTVHWVAGGSPTGSGSPLERAVRDGGRTGGRVQAWLAAEAGVMREVRRLLLGELGVGRTDLHSAAYWKSGLDGTRLDGVGLRRYQQEVAAGADPADPDTRDTVELDY
ncbi:siderophore-interacting protein [Streptomonospora halophila]|uniref:Siderophore-interacting protein n=1 Tax=Streptomonospora halophila TaxID=427369 RepID=A0ABP9G2E2_9ACTN